MQSPYPGGAPDQLHASASCDFYCFHTNTANSPGYSSPRQRGWPLLSCGILCCPSHQNKLKRIIVSSRSCRKPAPGETLAGSRAAVIALVGRHSDGLLGRKGEMQHSAGAPKALGKSWELCLSGKMDAGSVHQIAAASMALQPTPCCSD